MRLISAATLTSGVVGSAHALSLGDLRLHSALGQQLKAELEVAGADGGAVEQGCFKAKVLNADGLFLAPASLRLSLAGGVRMLLLSTRQGLYEPAIRVVVDLGCDVQLHREYQVLLDPPQYMAPQSDAEAAPVISVAAAPAGNKPTVAQPSLVRDQTLRTRPPSAKPKTSKLPKAVKDTLKLSDDVLVLPQALRLSESLSAEHAGAANREELRAAQAQLAAFLRDEKPDQFSGDKLRAEQQKILGLQQEAAQLKRRSQIDKAALEELKEASFSRNWVLGLSLFALAGMAVIALLLAYVQRMHKKFSSSWWEQKESKTGAEPKRNIEELLDGIQESYWPDSAAAAPAAHETEPEPSPLRSAPALKAKAILERQWEEMDSPSVFGNHRHSPTLEESNNSTFNFFSTRGQSVKVEEISDVTQEAEFWMSVNDPQRAIEILASQAAQEAPESPVPWLYLLDLYRIVGDRERYDGLRDRFIAFFNANIPAFVTDPATLPERHLEDFAHLMERICAAWNGPAVLPFLQGLLVDDRDGTRVGFDLPVYRDILLLIAIANELERAKVLNGERRRAGARENGLKSSAKQDDADGAEAGRHAIDFEVIDFKKNK
ncbi:MAG: hypothetical protein HYZ65_06740 [Burkholderiales bacterium]|nr:hypothetical protein [Burkholderiales bacterium]